MNILLARRIFEESYLVGEFRLRSGVVSSEYFDKYQFESIPGILLCVAEQLAKLVPSEVEFLAGIKLGGIPLVTMLSQITGLPALFVRKKAKEYGTRRLAEGGNAKGKRVVIVEDVVTSGGQIIDSVCCLREEGAIIDAALCVIDREAGAPESLRKHGIELRALFTFSDLGNAMLATDS
jgi:orotate phosphoribosyltransferase